MEALLFRWMALTQVALQMMIEEESCHLRQKF